MSLVVSARVPVFVATDYQDVAVGAVAVGLDAAKVAVADAVRIRYEGGAVRVRSDGLADPTTAVGEPHFDGDTHLYGRQEASRLKAIAQGADAATLRATFGNWA